MHCSATVKPSPLIRPPVPPQNPQLASLLADQTAAFAERIGEISRLAPPGSDAMQRAAAQTLRLLTQPVLAAPWNTHSITSGRRLEARQFSRTRLARIAARRQVAEREIILTMLGEALSRVLASTLVDQRNPRLRILCPAPAGDGTRAGPQLSATCVTINAHPQGAAARLEEVRAEIQRSAEEREADALALIMALAPPLPPAALPGQAPAPPPSPQAMLLMSFLRHPTPGDLAFTAPSSTLHQHRDHPFFRHQPFTMVCQIAASSRGDSELGGRRIVAEHFLPTLTEGLGLGAHVTLTPTQVTVDLASDPGNGVEIGFLAEAMTSTLGVLEDRL